MVCMTKKITRTWKIDEDVSESFAAWCHRTRTPLGDGAQLGIWLLMSLTPEQRQLCIEGMDKREPIPLGPATPGDTETAGDPEPMLDGLRKSVGRTAARKKSKSRQGHQTA